jgi:hypothetical protein
LYQLNADNTSIILRIECSPSSACARPYRIPHWRFNAATRDPKSIRGHGIELVVSSAAINEIYAFLKMTTRLRGGKRGNGERLLRGGEVFSFILPVLSEAPLFSRLHSRTQTSGCNSGVVVWVSPGNHYPLGFCRRGFRGWPVATYLGKTPEFPARAPTARYRSAWQGRSALLHHLALFATYPTSTASPNTCCSASLLGNLEDEITNSALETSPLRAGCG